MVSIDNLLSLMDRLIQFGKFRVEGRRRQFKEIAEPLFNSLQPLVEDYFLLFRESQDLIKKSSNSELPLAVEKIRANRGKLLQARTQAVAFANAINEEIKDKRMVGYAQKIVTFFYVTRHERNFLSKAHEVVELCDLVLENELSKEYLLQHIQETLNSLEESWKAIAQSYAALMLNSLK